MTSERLMYNHKLHQNNVLKNLHSNILHNLTHSSLHFLGCNDVHGKKVFYWFQVVFLTDCWVEW